MASFELPILVDVLDALTQIGDATRVMQLSPVGGGCIHRVHHLCTEKRAYLLKWNPKPLANIFEEEVQGLNLLAATGAVRVPQVLYVHCRPDFILLEWIQPDLDQPEWNQEQLGRQLAALHNHPAGPSYGLDHANYIGANGQTNTWHTRWAEFFRDCRLVPQMKMAAKSGALAGASLRKLEYLCAHLERWIDEDLCRPSLLHGDLWAGNVISGPAGQPVLIDPAVYYGEREAELAFTELFGGFSRRFYQAYHNAWPINPGYPERRDLYNLYHLLNHLNLFGPMYAGAVKTVIERYAGDPSSL